MNKETVKWGDLSKERQQKIKYSIQQINEGKGISHEEVMVEFRKQYDLKPSNIKTKISEK